MTTTKKSKAPTKKTAKKPLPKGKKKPRLADRWDKERLEKAVKEAEEAHEYYKKLSEIKQEQIQKEMESLIQEKERYRKKNNDLNDQIHILEKEKHDRYRSQSRINCRHMLKTTTNHFDAMWHGTKRMEARKADRDFYIGDYILLQEYDPNTDEWSGREILVEVTHILTGVEYGIMPGYVILSTHVVKQSSGFLLEKIIEENREHKLQQAIKEQNGSNYEKAPSLQAKDLRDQDTVHA